METEQKFIAWIGSGRIYRGIIDALDTTPGVTLEHFPDAASFFCFPKRSYDLYIPEVNIKSGNMQLPDRIYQGEEDKIALLVMKEIRQENPMKLMAVPHYGIPDNQHLSINKAGANAVIDIFKNSEDLFVNLALTFIRNDYPNATPSD